MRRKPRQDAKSRVLPSSFAHPQLSSWFGCVRRDCPWRASLWQPCGNKRPPTSVEEATPYLRFPSELPYQSLSSIAPA